MKYKLNADDCKAKFRPSKWSIRALRIELNKLKQSEKAGYLNELIKVLTKVKNCHGFNSKDFFQFLESINDEKNKLTTSKISVDDAELLILTFGDLIKKNCIKSNYTQIAAFIEQNFDTGYKTASILRKIIPSERSPAVRVTDLREKK